MKVKFKKGDIVRFKAIYDGYFKPDIKEHNNWFTVREVVLRESCKDGHGGYSIDSHGVMLNEINETHLITQCQLEKLNF